MRSKESISVEKVEFIAKRKKKKKKKKKKKRKMYLDKENQMKCHPKEIAYPHRLN